MSLKSVNRDALIIFPKKPLIDWVNYIFPDDPVSITEPLKHDNGNVYLIPENENIDESLNYLKRNFREIYKNELWDWCTDETTWPQNFSLKMFTEWFHFNIQSVVLDMDKTPLQKENWF